MQGTEVIEMWQNNARCAGMESFIQRGDVAAKKALCHTCPVISECLAFALQNEDFESTVYGGFTGEERKQLIKDGAVA